MIKFQISLVSHDIYGRYMVTNITEKGERQTCGYLDLTDAEFDILKFILVEGTSRLQDNEAVIEFNADDRVKAYLEGG